MLKVENLTKTYRLSKKQMKLENTKESKKIAANGVSFEVMPGEIFGLLGPNGAGKTTTLRCVSTLIKPDSGDVFIGDEKVSVVTEDDRARGYLSFLTSELKLEDHFTPNYLFNFFGRLHGLDEETIERNKERLFSKFGIEEFAEIKVSQLSTGMKQKTSIAVSLVHDPDIIIFDEPTNGLDILTARTVTDYLLELRNEGKTIIVSTHIMTLAAKLCDRIGIIIDGKIRKVGSLKDIIADTNSTDLEDAFFKIYKKAKEEDGGAL
ncbi:ATP-binding cassette domain-containing protein [Mycoplasmatota bacterium]|nr:ATP-binding cassette domain-containing protein [Mycoplasmatota bacterium]